MKSAIFISIRNKATRLPGKSFLKIGEMPLVNFMLERVKCNNKRHKCYVTTSTNPDDAIFREVCPADTEIFYGSEEDKLDRYYNAMIQYGLEAAVIIDGDDPYFFQDAVAQAIRFLEEERGDFCVYGPGPVGSGCIGVSKNALKSILAVKSEHNTEVWGEYFMRNRLFYTRQLIPCERRFELPEKRITLDYKEDYDFLRMIDRNLRGRVDFTDSQLVDCLNSISEDLVPNRLVSAKYEQNLKKSPEPGINFEDGLKGSYLIIGCGSMGRRRIRSLLALGVDPRRIYCTDTNFDRPEACELEYNVVQVHDLEISSKYAGVFICTPPDRHEEYIAAAINAGVPAFVEASVTNDSLESLGRKARESEVIIFPSNTMSYFEETIAIENIVQSGKLGQVFYWNYRVGHNLHEWHPWERVNDFYVSQPETGGCREIVPFELTWLQRCFGKINTAVASIHNLDPSIPVDDLYQVDITHESGLRGFLTVDTLNYVGTRDLMVVGELATLFWNRRKSLLEVVDRNGGLVEVEFLNVWPDSWRETGEAPYIAEVRDFLLCAKFGVQPYYSLSVDAQNLDVLYAAETGSGI